MESDRAEGSCSDVGPQYRNPTEAHSTSSEISYAERNAQDPRVHVRDEDMDDEIQAKGGKLSTGQK